MRNPPRYALLALLLAVPARSLEISLEENRAQRGNIGYVDLQRVFKLYPETQRAKQSFGEVVRQAEEQVNLRKAELMALRAEVSRLNMERELLEKTPIPAAEGPRSPEQPPAPREPPAPEPPLAPAATEQAQLQPDMAPSTPTAQGDPAPAEAPAAPPESGEPPRPASAASSDEGRGDRASGEQLRTDFDRLPGMGGPRTQDPPAVNIPGASSAPAVVQPPADPEAQGAAPGQSPPGTGAAPAGPAAGGSGPSAQEKRDARLRELEDQVAAKIAELGRKEAELKAYQAQVEKNLSDLESRRSEVLLGRIYTAVREVARENGVSVIVDKSQIVFGANTVDLTDKVLKKLEASQ